MKLFLKSYIPAVSLIISLIAAPSGGHCASGKWKRLPPSKGWIAVYDQDKSEQSSIENITPERRVNSLKQILEGTKIKATSFYQGATTFAYFKRLSRRQRNVLEQTSGIYVEPNVKFKLFLQEEPRAQTEELMPYGVEMIKADKVWKVTKGKGARVLVIDTGINKDHEDLSGQLKDGSGWYGSTRGYSDDQGHGTHVSGTIVAKHNQVGVPGIAPEAEYFVYKACSGIYCELSGVMAGVNWGIENKVNVISMSLGTRAEAFEILQSLRESMKKAYNAGITIVAAAGNDGDGLRQTGSNVAAPARYPEVIAVGAVDSAKNLASFSSQGPEVSVSAPGVKVLSTALIPPYKRPSYGYLSGTSMATPHVAALAALIISHPQNCEFKLDSRPGVTPDEVRKCIEESAEESPQDTKPGKDINFGYGIINAEKAVLGVASGGDQQLPAPESILINKISAGATVSWQPVANAVKYRVYVSSTETEKGSLLSEIDSAPYVHQFFGSAQMNYYSVAGVDAKGKEGKTITGRLL